VNFSKKISRTQKIFSGSFPAQFRHKLFPGISQKNFPCTRDNHPVRDFPKMPHRTFRQIPVSKSLPHAADPEKRNEKTAHPFIPVEPSPTANDRSSKDSSVCLGDLFMPNQPAWVPPSHMAAPPSGTPAGSGKICPVAGL